MLCTMSIMFFINYPNNLGEVYMFSGNFLHPTVTFSVLCVNFPFYNLFLNAFNLCTCLSMRDQVACQGKVSVKITLLHILVYMLCR